MVQTHTTMVKNKIIFHFLKHFFTINMNFSKCQVPIIGTWHFEKLMLMVEKCFKIGPIGPGFRTKCFQDDLLNPH